MAGQEIDSFIQKFKNLWKCGLDAHLNIDTHAGQAWVGLRVGLGGSHSFHGHQDTAKRRRGPAYQRRQERRQAAGDAAVAGVPNPLEEVCDLASSESVSADEVDSSEAGTSASAEQARSNTNAKKENDAEKVSDNFTCDLCEFVSNWAKGLRIHMTRMHPNTNVEQLDGNNSLIEVDDEEYSRSERYWKMGILGIAFQAFLDVNKIIESSDMNEEDKINEKSKVLEARKRSLGDSYKHFPPWS